MCGICCIFCHLEHDINIDHIRSKSALQNRGPDLSGHQITRISDDYLLHLFGFVLHLRGDITKQPVGSEDKGYLLWNGEIFGGLEINDDENDTKVLFEQLIQSTEPRDIVSALAKVQGPWTFIFWQPKNRQLWFGRDVFGRRSLLWHLPQDNTDVFCLSSVQVKPWEYLEIPAIGLFCLQFPPKGSDTQNGTPEHMTLYPWPGAVWPGTRDLIALTNTDDLLQCLYPNSTYINIHMDTSISFSTWMPKLNTELPPSDWTIPLYDPDVTNNEQSMREYLQNVIEKSEVFTKAAGQLLYLLQAAVKIRSFNLPRRKCYRISQTNTKICSTDPEITDRFRECFNVRDMTNTQTYNKRYNESTSVIDSRQVSLNSGHCRTNVGPSDKLSGVIAVDGTNASKTNNESNSVIASAQGFVTSKCVADFDNYDMALTNTECQGCDNCDPASELCPLEESQQSNVAILFSGGIDSTIIAALADRVIPPEESIDLLNVAFEHQMKNGTSKKKDKNHQHDKRNDVPREKTFDVPDRLTGYRALSELNPKRNWNFVEVNVTHSELQEFRGQRVSSLIYPLSSVLDDSIGCAVWFAARGEGILGNGPHRGNIYRSNAKVILCGMGADEQLAGYSRHRSTFREKGWPGIIKESELEITRISARNLGRDDRIIADHGKESRLPFLDEQVVGYLGSLPMHLKADLTLPRGLGEKLLLRLAAYQLGLQSTAVLPKRAIQFGSRIAKMENSKEKASDICTRLTDQ